MDHTQTQDDGFDMKKHVPIPWKAQDLRKGDRIVTQKNQKTNAITKTQLVKEIEHEPRGCKGKVHINDNDCYDYAGKGLEIALHPVVDRT
jgi:hypothetical protein